MLGDARAVAIQTAAVAVLRVPSTAATEPAPVLTAPRASLSDSLGGAPRAVTLVLAGVVAEVLHMVVALVVVLLIGFALFLPTWTGTYANMHRPQCGPSAWICRSTILRIRKSLASSRAQPSNVLACDLARAARGAVAHDHHDQVSDRCCRRCASRSSRWRTAQPVAKPATAGRMRVAVTVVIAPARRGR
jgi:hypothetical protein